MKFSIEEIEFLIGTLHRDERFLQSFGEGNEWEMNQELNKKLVEMREDAFDKELKKAREKFEMEEK